MISLLYVSETLVEEHDVDKVMDDIQAVSIARNSQLDITGALIATSAYFAQILEGPDEDVDLVMASIVRDPRHHRVRVLKRCDIAVRRFPRWRLARFSGDNFGTLNVAPVIAAAHAGTHADAVQQLERLIGTIAFNHGNQPARETQSWGHP